LESRGGVRFFFLVFALRRAMGAAYAVFAGKTSEPMAGTRYAIETAIRAIMAYTAMCFPLGMG
jgi:hypothetical protein